MDEDCIEVEVGPSPEALEQQQRLAQYGALDQQYQRQQQQLLVLQRQLDSCTGTEREVCEPVTREVCAQQPQELCNEVVYEDCTQETRQAVSYTHLTLPTTPYV